MLSNGEHGAAVRVLEPSFHESLAETVRSGGSGVVVTVVDTRGSTPRKRGAKMLVHPNAEIVGTIGGGKLEQVAIRDALDVLKQGAPRLQEYELTRSLGMCCGGRIALFFDPLAPKPPLIVFGAGHVGAALTQIASQSGFSVHVVDERPEFLNAEHLPSAAQLYDDLEDPSLPFGPDCRVMIATHDHGLDQELTERITKKMPHRWLGVIGSRRKAELTRARLSARGIADEKIRRIHCPAGISIGAETPIEIAISITAELVADRRSTTNKLDIEEMSD